MTAAIKMIIITTITIYPALLDGSSVLLPVVALLVPLSVCPSAVPLKKKTII